MPRTRTPNSMLPSATPASDWPAVRTVRRSPTPMSSTTSGGTRESTQPRTTAIGSWPSSSCSRVAASTAFGSGVPATNRPLPATIACNATSAEACAPAGAGIGILDDESGTGPPGSGAALSFAPTRPANLGTGSRTSGAEPSAVGHDPHDLDGPEGLDRRRRQARRGHGTEDLRAGAEALERLLVGARVDDHEAGRGLDARMEQQHLGWHGRHEVAVGSHEIVGITVEAVEPEVALDRQFGGDA